MFLTVTVYLSVGSTGSTHTQGDTDASGTFTITESPDQSCGMTGTRCALDEVSVAAAAQTRWSNTLTVGNSWKLLRLGPNTCGVHSNGATHRALKTSHSHAHFTAGFVVITEVGFMQTDERRRCNAFIPGMLQFACAATIF
jgi:hypothetical protein